MIGRLFLDECPDVEDEILPASRPERRAASPSVQNVVSVWRDVAVGQDMVPTVGSRRLVRRIWFRVRGEDG